jgi:hypothetical protein
VASLIDSASTLAAPDYKTLSTSLTVAKLPLVEGTVAGGRHRTRSLADRSADVRESSELDDYRVVATLRWRSTPLGEASLLARRIK